MEFGDNIVQFNILDAIKHSMEKHFVFYFDVVEHLVEEFLKLFRLDNSIASISTDCCDYLTFVLSVQQWVRI